MRASAYHRRMHELDAALGRFRTALLTACGLSLLACTSPPKPETNAKPEPETEPVFTELEPEHAPTTPSRCADPTPIMIGGGPSGYVTCADGAVDRAVAQACANPINAPACKGSENHRECETHADCMDKPNGHCMSGSGQIGSYCGCVYPCLSDESCEAGFACLCPDVAEYGPPVSVCVPAQCKTNADCPTGSWAGECGVSLYHDGCSHDWALQCRTGEDACRGDAECSNGGTCGVDTYRRSEDDPRLGHFECMMRGCAIGRPLTVFARSEVGVRVAALARRAWDSTRVEGLETSRPRALHWLAIARMEHASVASFARFIGELLALGAPPELVRDAAAAAADEVRHARSTFALTRAYAGEDVGPGGLRVDDLAGGAVELRRFVTQLVREGCVGETVGVAEVLALLEEALAPALRPELERIAADESRHAALAWRTLQWIAPRVEPAWIDAAFEDAIAEVLAVDAETVDPTHGRLGTAAKQRVRARAIASVIEPCRRALAQGARHSDHAASQASRVS